MKQTRLDSPQHMSTHADDWQEICQRVLVRDGFHCRICHAGGNLKCYCRKDWHEGYELNDVIALCEQCYAQAQTCKQRRRQNETLERIAFLACLFLAVSLMVFALATLSSSTLSMLCLMSLCIAGLVEVFSSPKA
jgi:hypothetical protein